MDEKRLEILERASHVFMKYGIKSVTMDDLSRELGISKKTFYKYFEDKNDIVRSIIELKVQMDRALCSNTMCQSENAIDQLINISRLVIEHIGNVNPTVFYDLQKYHADAWQIMTQHKWEFVLSMIRENIEQGIKEKIYRDNLDPEIIARLYVGSTDMILNGDVFPWPEFKFQNVFTEMIRFHIKGMASDKGIEYLRKRLENETTN